MKPTLVQYDAPGWGVGEVWLDEDGRVFHSELPRPTASSRLRAAQTPAMSLRAGCSAFFAGAADDFADVPLRLDRTGSTATAPARC